MRDSDKLPPLADAFDDAFTLGKQSERDDHTRESRRAAANHAIELAAPYDALIRQQEARIAELEAEVATLKQKGGELCCTAGNLMMDKSRLEAELAKFRELAREAAMTMKTHDHAYADVWMRRTTERLAALHKEE